MFLILWVLLKVTRLFYKTSSVDILRIKLTNKMLNDFFQIQGSLCNEVVKTCIIESYEIFIPITVNAHFILWQIINLFKFMIKHFIYKLKSVQMSRKA